MTSLLLVPLAGFLGSFHCAAMCGPFVGFYTLAGTGSRRGRHLAYHLGRLTAYMSLGLLVGWLGQGFLYLSTLLDVQRVMVISLGAVMIAIGLVQYFPRRWQFWRKAPAGRPWYTKLVGPRPGVAGAGMLGLLSTLLPCGFLYSFAFVAGASAHPVSGLVIMLGFWAGTLPMLLGLSTLVTRLSPKTTRFFYNLTPAFLILFGILAMLGKWHAFPSMVLGADHFCPIH